MSFFGTNPLGRRTRPPLLLVSVLGGLCTLPVGGCEGRTRCEAEATGECGPRQDAGSSDGSVLDDAATQDAGAPDSGTPDSGTPDSGAPDAGAPDAGAPDAGSPDAGPPAPPWVPSLYGYSVGARSYYRGLLADFCHGPSLPGSSPPSAQDYAYTVYPINLFGLRTYGAAFYAEDLGWLLRCARKTGRLRVIVRFDFYEYDTDPETGRRISYQKHLLCRNDNGSGVGRPLREGCPDVLDGDGNVARRGYLEPDVDSTVDALAPLWAAVPELAQTFEGTERRVLAGITLSEENVTWDYTSDGNGGYQRIAGRRAEFLGQLYTALSTRFDADFLQWYSPTLTLNYPGSSANWPEIPSDGWVFDAYHLSVVSEVEAIAGANVRESDFFEYASKMSELGVPSYGIVWSSPLRYPRGSEPDINHLWWNAWQSHGHEGGWVRFYGQVAVLQHFEIPTLYYPYTPVQQSGTAWADTAWDRIAGRCGEGLLVAFSEQAWRWIPENPISLTIPAAQTSWIPSAPASCE